MRSFTELSKWAVHHPSLGKPVPDAGGAYSLPHPNGPLRVIASWAEGWDHVSVSRPMRCPSWEEMEHVKRAFFHADEVAMQLHVPPADHVNYHRYCLHLWRPHHVKIPRPPSYMVA